MKIHRHLARKMLDDPHMTMFLGLMFIVSGLISATRDSLSHLLNFEIKLFHGLIFLGVFNLTMAVVFIVMGARTVEAGMAAERAVKNEAPPSVDSEDLRRRLEALEARLAALEKPAPPPT